MTENKITKAQYKYICTLLTTWRGFNKVRRQNDLSITYSYCLLGCLFMEAQNVRITQGYMRRLMVMYNPYVINKAFLYLIEKKCVVSAGSAGKRSYYALTDLGRLVALDLLAGCEAAQVEFFNKFPMSF